MTVNFITLRVKAFTTEHTEHTETSPSITTYQPVAKRKASVCSVCSVVKALANAEGIDDRAVIEHAEVRQPERIEPFEPCLASLQHRDRRGAAGHHAARRVHGHRLEPARGAA